MGNKHKNKFGIQRKPCNISLVRRSFIVKLYDESDRLLETVKVIAKGRKTACSLAKFQHSIGWNYSVLAEPENCA